MVIPKCQLKDMDFSKEVTSNEFVPSILESFTLDATHGTSQMLKDMDFIWIYKISLFCCFLKFYNVMCINLKMKLKSLTYYLLES